MSDASSLTGTYTYDKTDRLTGATIGSNIYIYGFGTEDPNMLQKLTEVIPTLT